MNIVAFLNSISVPLQESLWRATWQGAVAVAIVWAISRVWRRIPGGVLCTLWLLVSLRMLFALTPPALQLPILPNPVATATSAPTRVAVHQSVSLYSAATVSQLMPTVRTFYPERSISSLTRAARPVSPPPVSLSPAAGLILCWFFAAAVTGAVSLGQMLRAVMLLRRSEPITERDLLAVAEQVRMQVGLRTRPHLVRVRQGCSDFTFGLVQPTVALSTATLNTCSEEELRIVLAHEFAHVLRRDSVLGLVPMLSQVLFCFHPLAWIANREYLLARESACDEIALRSLNVGSEPYGRLLLKLSGAASLRAPLCTPGVSSTFKLLRRRIAMLEQPTQPSTALSRVSTRYAAGLAFVLCAAPLYVVASSSSAHAVTAKLVSHRITQSGDTPNPFASKGQLQSNDPLTSANTADKKNPVLSARPTSTKVKAAKPATGKKPSSQETSPNLIASKTNLSSLRLISDLFHKHPSQLSNSSSKTSGLQISLFTLKFAKSGQVAKLLNDVLSLGKERAGRASSDEFTNTVVVSCDESLLPQIRKVISQLDVMGQTQDPLANSRPASDSDSVRIYHLQNAGADEVAAILNAAFSKQASVSTDKRTNSVVVAASDAAQRKVTDVLTRLDIPANLTASIPAKKRNELYKIPAALFKEFLKLASHITHETIDTVSYGGDENFFIVRGTEDELRQISVMEARLRLGQ